MPVWSWVNPITVNAAGPASDASEAPAAGVSVVYINLTYPGDPNVAAFSNQWFYAADNSKDEMLAVALTAISMGATVGAGLVPPDPTNPNAFPQIYRFYLNAP